MNIMHFILLVVWIHFVSDFLLQTDSMAKNKSKSFKWLTFHVFVYAAPFAAILGLKYAAVNFALHWITDFCSSRITSRLWEKKQVHWFFAVIGFDQAIHMTCLILTYPLAALTLINI